MWMDSESAQEWRTLVPEYTQYIESFLVFYSPFHFFNPNWVELKKHFRFVGYKSYYLLSEDCQQMYAYC